MDSPENPTAADMQRCQMGSGNKRLESLEIHVSWDVEAVSQAEGSDHRRRGEWGIYTAFAVEEVQDKYPPIVELQTRYPLSVCSLRIELVSYRRSDEVIVDPTRGFRCWAGEKRDGGNAVSMRCVCR